MWMGYDAKRAFNNATGLGNYARDLIRGVERQCPQWKLALFTPYQKISFPCKGQVITPQFPLARVVPSLWRSYGITRRAARLPLDLFHGLSQEIPWGIHRTTRTVVTIHDLISLLRPQDFNWPDSTLYNTKLRYAARHAHHILTFSEDSKRHLIHLLQVPEQKITILPQSCHPAFLQPYGPHEIATCLKKYSLHHRPYMHFVGSFIPRKKPWELLQAFCQIAGQVEVDLAMMGQGPLRKKCQQLVTEKGLSSRVHFVSPESPEEMAQIAQASQLLAYPSVAEGFGIPILEAHFSRTAVLTSPFSCLPEIAGRHAYYVEPDNGAELADELKSILHSPQEREQMAAQSHQWAQQFTPERVTERLVQYYQSLN